MVDKLFFIVHSGRLVRTSETKDDELATRYMIACQARTGSTMLSTALQNHPEICAHGEVLNDRDDQILAFFGLVCHSSGAILDILRAKIWTFPTTFLYKFVFKGGWLQIQIGRIGWPCVWRRPRLCDLQYALQDYPYDPMQHLAETFVGMDSDQSVIRPLHLQKSLIF